MKTILLNSALVLFAVALSLSVAEITLRIDGRYYYLASQELVPSPAIWEPPANRTELSSHPDLNVPIEIRFDADGVRNHSPTSTGEQRNIVGFFGDSYTENRRIEDRFSFTSILDVATRPGARIVNYGVDGYGLDQSYLRYKKYESHDIRHVVYVICQNDLQDLYETGLTELTKDGDITFNAARNNPFRHLIGRFHLTYLILSGYYDLVRHVRMMQVEDTDAITSDFLSVTPSENVSQLARKFLLLLNKWKREVEAANRTFTVLVLPRKIDTDVASKLLRDFDGNIVQSIGYFGNCSNCTFRNDPHWNEYGNLKMAGLISSSLAFPFHGIFKPIDFAGLKLQIDEYYQTRK